MNCSGSPFTARDRKGAILPIIAVCLIILFVSAALAIDIARIHVTRSELRTATDAAAKAAVEALGREQDMDAAIAAAIDVAGDNRVAGENLTLTADQIEFGSSTPNKDGSFQFNADQEPFNSVRVKGDRTAGSVDGPVGLLFGPMFGVTDFQPLQFATATRLDRDIALVLDVSGSMRTDNRFGALKDALDVFLAELEASTPEERLSLTVYSTSDRKLQDLTDNFQLIRDAFADESPGGRTAIGKGLKTGLNSVLKDRDSRRFALKSIVVMTDGNHNEGISPDLVAPDCAAKNVVVHTITFSAGANQTLMKKVAEETGGQHVHATSNAQLSQAFEEIARQLQVLIIE